MFDILEDAAPARPILEAAAALLGQVHGRIARPDPLALHANREGQILVTARALATAACLKIDGPLIVAGYSVGEMAASSIAGIWPAEAALRLTAGRAEIMDRAAGDHTGLAYVRGLKREAVERLVHDFACAVAIVAPDRLFIIGGNRNDLGSCCLRALEEGATAARMIPVTVASHTPILRAAVAPFETLLTEAEACPPRSDRTLVSGLDGEAVTSAPTAIAGLARQLATTLEWSAALQAVVERGVERLLELGPGSALADMVRAAYPGLPVRSVDEFRSLRGVREWLAA